MTDLELLDQYCETCLDMPHPVIFRDIQARNLVYIVNYLPSDIDEAKAVIRARLALSGKYTGDPEIEQIASVVDRLCSLRDKLRDMNLADVHKTLPILSEMQEHSQFLLDYYKKKPMP